MTKPDYKRMAEVLRTTTKPQTLYSDVSKFPLTGNYCFCALGVLGVEVAGFTLEEDHRGPWLNPPEGNSDGIVTTLGLTRKQGIKIMDWNDTDRLSFPQIADKIEKELPSLA